MAGYIIIIDGLCDEPKLEQEIINKLECLPNFSKIIKQSSYGFFNNKVKGLSIDSYSCISTILGVDLTKTNGGRAYFEALSHDIKVDNDDLILRCNISSFENDKLIYTNAYGLSKNKLKYVYNLIERNINDEIIQIHHLNDYKGIAVLKGAIKYENKIPLFPPHELMGKKVELSDNFGNSASKIIIDAMKKSQILLSKIYVDKNINYSLLFWGVSHKCEYPKLFDIHKKTIAIVAGTEIVKGLAKAYGANLISNKTLTGDVDTNLREKAKLAINAKKIYDIVVIHINAIDELSHRKDFLGKIKYLENIDEFILKPILQNKDKNDKILICADHGTSSKTAAHLTQNVPFWLFENQNAIIKNKGIVNGINALNMLNQ